MSTEKLNFSIFLVSSIAALAGLLFGFDTGIISGALLLVEKTFPLTTSLKEFIVASVLLGAMLSSVLSGRVTDTFGRKNVMLVVAALFIVGTALATIAANPAMIIIGRLIIGFAIGIGSYTAPLYIAEAAPMELRGGLVTLNQLAITAGIMMSYGINYSFMESVYSWRWMFAIGVIPAVILGIGMLFLPDSPRWLMKKNKPEKAKNVLQRLRNRQDVSDELAAIQKTLNSREAHFFDVFKPKIRPVLLLGIFVGVISQITGINTIIYYAPTLFKISGVESFSATIIATFGIGIVNFLATIFAVMYLDKAGRRPLFFTGLSLMGLSLFALCSAFYFGIEQNFCHYLALVSIFIYIIAYAISLGPLSWLMEAEIFPISIRASAMSVAIFCTWTANFAVSVTFLTFLEKFGPENTFFGYFLMCILGLIVGYYCLPETKGVSLEAIDENIQSGLPVREIGVESERRKSNRIILL